MLRFELFSSRRDYPRVPSRFATDRSRVGPTDILHTVHFVKINLRARLIDELGRRLFEFSSGRNGLLSRFGDQDVRIDQSTNDRRAAPVLLNTASRSVDPVTWNQ